jgi:hypothetical protein
LWAAASVLVKDYFRRALVVPVNLRNDGLFKIAILSEADCAEG